MLNVLESFKNSRVKRYLLYLSFIGVYTAAIFIFAHIKAASTEASVLLSPLPQFTSAQLVDDINIRLQFLQRHVTGAAFCVHKIKSKENLWKLAARRHFSVHSIIGCNPQLKTYDVSIGQEILMPSRGGTLHRIQKGDSWESIASRYKITSPELAKANSSTDSLVEGNMVFVPGARPDMEFMNDDMKKKYELRALFTSPLGGRLTSTFGRRIHPVTGQRSIHGGIDIAVKEGTWVGAAAPGVVTVASDCAGHYGKAVFIQHQNGYETQYGHLSKILVHEGQKVREHQLIAKSGSTGRSTGPHLHFTIKKNGVALDPLKFLW